MRYMDGPTHMISSEDQDVFEKLGEARELYAGYLSIVSAAEQATLHELASWGMPEDGDPESSFEPQPLTISFRPAG